MFHVIILILLFVICCIFCKFITLKEFFKHKIIILSVIKEIFVSFYFIRVLAITLKHNIKLCQAKVY